VVVVGSDEKTGSWNPQNSEIKLCTDAASYPYWAGTADLPKGFMLSFKFAVLSDASRARWEEKIDNRSLQVQDSSAKLVAKFDQPDAMVTQSGAGDAVQTASEKASIEKAAAEKASAEKAAAEKAAAQQAAADKAAAEKVAKAEAEEAAAKKAAVEKAAADKAAAEKAAAERAAAEKAAQRRLPQKRLQQKRLQQKRLQQKRLPQKRHWPLRSRLWRRLFKTKLKRLQQKWTPLSSLRRRQMQQCHDRKPRLRKTRIRNPRQRRPV